MSIRLSDCAGWGLTGIAIGLMVVALNSCSQRENAVQEVAAAPPVSVVDRSYRELSQKTEERWALPNPPEDEVAVWQDPGGCQYFVTNDGYGHRRLTLRQHARSNGVCRSSDNP